MMIAILSATMAAGCAASSKTSDDPDDRLRLELFVRDATHAEKLFRVEKRELHFGGGLDARLQNTTWTTPLSEAEIASITHVIEQVGWPKTKPIFSGEPKEQSWRILVRTEQGFARFKGRGTSESAQQVHDVLDRIALRRLEGDLERLPRPGPRP